MCGECNWPLSEPKNAGKILLEIPMRLMSEANTHQHWRKKYERNKRQQKAVRLTWLSKRPHVSLPCRISFTRSGPRKLDFDNLVYAFKAIRDEVADLLIPGKENGQADSDERLEFSYKQEIGLYGIRIEIEELASDDGGGKIVAEKN
jgi:hypothetical protein